MVRSLGDVCSARVWLAEEEVRRLQAECGRTETLEEVYGKELSRREKEVKKQQTFKREQEQREQQEEQRRQQKEKERLERQLARAGRSRQLRLSRQQPQQRQQRRLLRRPSRFKLTLPASKPTLTATLTATIAAESSVSPPLCLSQPAVKKQPRSAPHPPPSPAFSHVRLAGVVPGPACALCVRACHADRAHHYTFHVDYLHSSIPALRIPGGVRAARQPAPAQPVADPARLRHLRGPAAAPHVCSVTGGLPQRSRAAAGAR